MSHMNSFPSSTFQKQRLTTLAWKQRAIDMKWNFLGDSGESLNPSKDLKVVWTGDSIKSILGFFLHSVKDMLN